ncbi:hypothetical protein DJ030_03355 [bacterium endosymbiont of Escarpia laminata]|nr:MAG: hypothetical protein DJ030_03355 [bacterium endosymbiont of Escarpia laminata]
MSIKSRLSQLEKATGEISDKHYLMIIGNPGESKDELVAKAIKEEGLTKEQVGKIAIFGHGFYEEVDFGGYGKVEELQGWNEIQRMWADIIDNLPPTVGPPSERGKRLPDYP